MEDNEFVIIPGMELTIHTLPLFAHVLEMSTVPTVKYQGVIDNTQLKSGYQPWLLLGVRRQDGVCRLRFSYCVTAYSLMRAFRPPPPPTSSSACLEQAVLGGGQANVYLRMQRDIDTRHKPADAFPPLMRRRVTPLYGLGTAKHVRRIGRRHAVSAAAYVENVHIDETRRVDSKQGPCTRRALWLRPGRSGCRVLTDVDPPHGFEKRSSEYNAY